jgi:hypothetical protein
VLNTALLVCIFGFKTQDGRSNVLFFSENVKSHDEPHGSECLAQIGEGAEEKETVAGSKYKEMFKLKALHLLALFILVYVGVEVTIGGKFLTPSRFLCNNTVCAAGWIVTYAIQVRHGGPSSGYISSGFFGGEPTLMTSVQSGFNPHPRLDRRSSCAPVGKRKGAVSLRATHRCLTVQNLIT